MRIRGILKIIVSVLCLIVIVAIVIFLATRYATLPEQVPTNYDARGQIAGYDGKSALISLTVINAVAYVLQAYILFRPLSKGGATSFLRLRIFQAGNWSRGNLSSSAAEKDPVRANNAVIDMVLVMMPAICIGMSYLIVCGALSRPVGALFLPLFIVSIVLPVVVATVRLVLISSAA